MIKEVIADRVLAMALFDMSLPDLEQFLPDRDEREDFDVFWADTLAEQDQDLALRVEPHSRAGTMIEIDDLTYGGFGGDPIKGWHLRPAEAFRRGSAVVQYTGYSSGRGYPHQWLNYAVAGFDVFVMDTRGQGGASEHVGHTPDPFPNAANEVPGMMTRGIEHRDSYYLRRVYVDAVRFIDVVKTIMGDAAPSPVIACGSQGAGIGLAVTGLRNDLELALLDVPSFALIRRHTEISNVGSRNEIARYLAIHREAIDTVFETLSYFDTVNFAARSHAEAAFSVGLMDQICPPSTVFAAYNHYAGPKRMQVWPYNGHEGGGPLQAQRHVEHLLERR